MKKKIKDKELKIKYVYRPTPDAEEKLQRAFDILFNEVDLYKNNKDLKTEN